MKKLLLVGFVVVIASASGDYFPAGKWATKSPKALGWSEKKFRLAKEYFLQSASTAVMVIDKGYIVASWGDVDRRVNVHSVRKSFLSALIGIHVQKGEIHLSDSLKQLHIDDKQKLTNIEKEATVADLLKARSGVYHPAAYETRSMKKRRPQRGSHFPGTFYYYNNWDFNTLGSIFEKKTSQKIFTAFSREIADFIGMQDFRESDCRYVKENVSIYPAYEFYMSARDRARFGLLFLRNGKWKGKQIIPTEWIKESTTPYSQVSKGIGYGYMWWVSTGNWHLGSRIHGKAYSARGHWGQYIVILPEEELVVVQVSDKSTGDSDMHGRKFNKLIKLILNAKRGD